MKPPKVLYWCLMIMILLSLCCAMRPRVKVIEIVPPLYGHGLQNHGGYMIVEDVSDGERFIYSPILGKVGDSFIINRFR
jgi:hypothetical protein